MQLLKNSNRRGAAWILLLLVVGQLTFSSSTISANPLIIARVVAWLGQFALQYALGKFIDYVRTLPDKEIEDKTAGLREELTVLDSHLKELTDGLGEVNFRLKSVETNLGSLSTTVGALQAREAARRETYKNALARLAQADSTLGGYSKLLHNLSDLSSIRKANDTNRFEAIYYALKAYSNFDPEAYFAEAITDTVNSLRTDVATLGRKQIIQKAQIKQLDQKLAATQTEVQTLRDDFTKATDASQRHLADHEHRIQQLDTNLTALSGNVAVLLDLLRDICCLPTAGHNAIALHALDATKFNAAFGLALSGALIEYAARENLEIQLFPAVQGNVLYFLDYSVSCYDLSSRAWRCVASVVLRRNDRTRPDDRKEMARCQLDGFGLRDALAYNDLEQRLRAKAHELERMFEQVDCGGSL